MSIPAELAEDFAFVQATWANSGGTQGATPEMEQRADALGTSTIMPSYAPLAPKCNFSPSPPSRPRPRNPSPSNPSPSPRRRAPRPGWVKTANGWGDPKLFAESAAETLAWAYPPQVFTNYPPPSSSSSAPQPVAEPAPEPADDAKSEASDVESDINDFIDFDVPIPYDSESSSDSEGDNENPTRKRRIIKTKSIVKKKFMETTSFTDNSERVKDPAKAHEKDLKLGAGIARSRVTSHYSERLTQHVKTIEKRVLCNELRKELERKRRHERLVQYQINKARIAERKQKEAAELKARIEAQQQREAEAAAALAAQRERERQDLVQAAQSLPRIPLKSAPEGLIELVSDDDDSDFEML
eukprot:tig00000367_g24446.t1